MQEYLIVKLGGSIITPKKTGEMVMNKDLIDEIILILSEFCNKNNLPILLCHGAGSFGHVKAKKFLEIVQNLDKNEINNFLNEIHSDVKELNYYVRKEAKAKFRNEILLDVIHGDVNFSGPPYIFSTEEQIYMEASKLKENGYKAKKIILLTDTDGLLDLDGKVVENVNKDYKIKNNLIFLANTDATGGMKQKIKKALELKEIAQEIVILNGLKPDRLKSELDGEKIIATRVS